MATASWWRTASQAARPVVPPLYAEALSQPDGPAPSYAKMFRYNVETLVKGMAAN